MEGNIIRQETRWLLVMAKLRWWRNRSPHRSTRWKLHQQAINEPWPASCLPLRHFRVNLPSGKGLLGEKQTALRQRPERTRSPTIHYPFFFNGPENFNSHMLFHFYNNSIKQALFFLFYRWLLWVYKHLIALPTSLWSCSFVNHSPCCLLSHHFII